MNKFINYSEFMHYLIDDEKKADKGGEIVKGLLAAKSPRLSNIAEQMEGQSESNYKAIHRFIGQTDVKEALLRLYQEKADFVIGDPTEMPRYKAPKTEYVGTLSDGQTPGYSRRTSGRCGCWSCRPPFGDGRFPFTSSPIRRKPSGSR